MKTTETRSYLSRLIWATNDWKRPQYGNPDTKPIWWPNELLNWSEMKKMGGKKSAGLTNVNYNEIQKNILYEVGYFIELLTKQSGILKISILKFTTYSPPSRISFNRATSILVLIPRHYGTRQNKMEVLK